MAELNIESQIYKLYELRTRLTGDKEKYEQMQKDYETITDILDNTERSKELPEEFIKGIGDSLEQIKTSIAEMTLRLDYIQVLIDRHENGDENVAQIATLVFAALGIDVKPSVENE